MSLMQTLSEINNNIYKVKRIIKLNKRNFYHNNVNYFILIKLAIFAGLSNREKTKVNNNKIFSGLKFMFKLPFFLISKFLYYFYLQKNLKKTDVVFFSDNNFYYDKYKKKKYNAFIDPYFEFISKKYTATKLEISHHSKIEKQEKYYKPIYLKLLYLNITGHVIYKFKNYFSSKNEIFFKDLSDKLKKIKVNLDTNDIKDKYHKINFHSQILEKILNKINPKVVFLTCYYNDLSLAIILACKKLNIKTVDIQHGGIEPEHLMYKYWQKSELKTGYDLMPNFFWIWQKEQLNETFFHKNKNHKTIEGGKLFLNKSEEIIKDEYNYLSDKEKFFIKSFKKFEKIILFCATEAIPTSLLKAIKLSQKKNNWIWLIRLHPRHGDFNLVKKKLDEYKISMKNVHIHEPTKINLFLLLKNSTHIIIDQSSVCLDAAYFNKPVICLAANKNMFKSWHKLKVCKFSLDHKKIIKNINSHKKSLCYKKMKTSCKESELKKIINN